MKITIDIRPPDEKLPPTGEYYKILHHYEDPNFVPIGSAPSVIASRTDIWVDMPEPFQWWFWRVWNIYAPDDMPLATRQLEWDEYWHSRTAWTNFGHGSDVCASYPTAKNLTAPPMARETLGSRGSIIKLQDGFTAKSDLWWPFDAIKSDAYNLYAPAEFARMFWLCCPSTIQTDVKLSDGTYRVNRFPHLTGRDVPTPLLTRDGVIWFRKDAVQRVFTRESAYNPSRVFNPAL
jgi:hypothetical protein